MQQRVELTEREINRDLLRPNLTLQLRFFVVVAVCGAIVAMAGGALAYAIIKGVGVYGVNRPVMWGFIIVNFVFWIGISHAGIMVSAILRLTQAEWRRPITRAAEVLTVFSLTSALMAAPLTHVGRQWRVLYWVFPYDFARGVWPNIRSPFIWDPSAVMTYLTASALFVFVCLLPDLAVIRDRTTGFPHKLYSFLCLGWRGTPRQWKLQIVAGIMISALAVSYTHLTQPTSDLV